MASTDWENVSIDEDFIDKLEEKNEFSGFDRQESVKIIRRLAKELRGWLKEDRELSEAAGQTLKKFMDEVEKEYRG